MDTTETSSAMTLTEKHAWLPMPQTFEEAWRIAKLLSDSDLVPECYRGNPANCLVALQWGADLGLPGLQALQNIAVINGRPSIWGDAALALAQNSAACEDIQEWIEGDDGKQQKAVCVVKRRGRSDVRREFSFADANQAGLLNKKGPWQAYPKRMLQMRARSFALRDAFPDVLRGLVLAEEAQDIREKDMGEAQREDDFPMPEATKPEPEPKPKPNPEPEPEPKPEPPKASPGMIKMLKAKAESRNLAEEKLLEVAEVADLRDLTPEQFNGLMTWIKTQG